MHAQESLAGPLLPGNPMTFSQSTHSHSPRDKFPTPLFSVLQQPLAPSSWLKSLLPISLRINQKRTPTAHSNCSINCPGGDSPGSSGHPLHLSTGSARAQGSVCKHTLFPALPAHQHAVISTFCCLLLIPHPPPATTLFLCFP